MVDVRRSTETVRLKAMNLGVLQMKFLVLVSWLLWANLVQGAIYFVSLDGDPSATDQSQKVEWKIFEKNSKVYFDGYCSTGPSYSFIEDDLSGCNGVDADHFFQSLQFSAGVSEEQHLSDKTIDLILKDQQHRAAVPLDRGITSALTEKKNKIKGIETIRKQYIAGGEDIVCYDNKNNALLALGMKCSTIMDGFKRAARTEHRSQLGDQLREGLLVEKRSIRAMSESDHYRIDGLLLDEHHFRYCGLKVLTPNTFKLSCIENVTLKLPHDVAIDVIGAGLGLRLSPGVKLTTYTETRYRYSFDFASAQYSCDLSGSLCTKEPDARKKQSAFPETFSLLKNGGLYHGNGTETVGSNDLLPLKSSTDIYVRTKREVVSGLKERREQPPYREAGGPILLRWQAGSEPYDFKHFQAEEDWGNLFDLNVLLTD